MIRHISFLISLFLIISHAAIGQKQRNCIIDTNRILLNLDLDSFIHKLNEEPFTVFNGKENIPKFVMNRLNCLTGGFSLANPEQEYQCCCTSSQKLPRRKLLYLAKSRNTLVMTYLTGGYGVSVRLLLIQFSGQRIERIWSGFAFTELKSNNEIISYIKENRHKKWGLNTNGVYL